VRRQCCCTVGTDNPQVLNSIVISNTIDVVEDHCHALTAPELILAAHLAAWFLQTLLQQTPLQILARTGGVLH
jgi:formate hydrogenlyase subunit 4